MKVRLITSTLGIALFLVLLFAPPLAFYIADVVVAGIAIYEVYSVAGIVKKPTIAFAGILGTLLCVLFGLAHLKMVDYSICFFAISLFIAYIFAIMIFDYKRVKLCDAAVAFFGALFPALLFSYIVPIRAHAQGQMLIIALFAATWGGDGGAYFVGIRFGKHKLSPRLSPKKTVEGAFGGVLGSIAAMVIFSSILIYILKVPCNVPLLIVTGALCAVLGPIGDIATSAIKREFSVKDYGNIFPGHGGILDRFDSILLTTPFVYFMSEVFNLIG